MSAGSLAIALLSVAGMVSLGHALLTIMVRPTHLYWFERWALAYLTGMAGLSVLWLAFAPVFRAAGTPVLFAICLGAAVFAFLRWTPPHEIVPEPLHPTDRGLAVAIALECLAVTVVALRSTLGFDGIFNFEMKARLMWEHPSGRLPLAYLSDASRNWSHPQYPLMVPSGELWVYTWLGGVDQSAAKILFPLFYLCLTAFVCGAVRRICGLRAGLAAGVALGLMPPLTLLPGASSGYADVPLAAAVAGAVSFAGFAITTGDRDAIRLSGLLAGIAAWTKAEGLVLAACVAILAFVLLHRPSFSKDGPSFAESSALVVLPLAAAVPWLVIQKIYGLPATDFVPVSVANVLSNLPRLPVILDLTARELLRPGHWGLIWPAWLLAILLVVRRRRFEAFDLFLIGVVALPLMFYVAPFQFSAWRDVDQHVRSALPRLLVPLAPVVVLFTTVTLWREWEASRT